MVPDDVFALNNKATILHKNWSARSGIAMLKFELGDTAEAKADLKSLIIDFPGDAISLNELAEIEMQSCNFHESLEYVNRAISKN